jgi:hypothetical protein
MTGCPPMTNVINKNSWWLGFFLVSHLQSNHEQCLFAIQWFQFRIGLHKKQVSSNLGSILVKVVNFVV